MLLQIYLLLYRFPFRSKIANSIQNNATSGEDILLKSEEFNSKIRVLKQLDFIDKSDILTLKGKFAQHISSADIIILTLFVFEGGFIGKLFVLLKLQ